MYGNYQLPNYFDFLLEQQNKQQDINKIEKIVSISQIQIQLLLKSSKNFFKYAKQIILFQETLYFNQHTYFFKFQMQNKVKQIIQKKRDSLGFFRNIYFIYFQCGFKNAEMIIERSLTDNIKSMQKL
ncbi:hypothetical protein ABPG72_002888 [Tetrahymena utriculariae]